MKCPGHMNTPYKSINHKSTALLHPIMDSLKWCYKLDWIANWNKHSAQISLTLSERGIGWGWENCV